jgi:nitrite reductase (NADH) large subunit
MQDDPWAERAAGKHAELHAHLAEVRPLQMEKV